MALDFPASPTTGQIFTPPGGPTYIFDSPRWLLTTVGTAQARNRIVNPAFQHSQENGTANVGPMAYFADQWLCALTSSGGATAYIQLVAGPSPNGSPLVFSTTVATTASVAAGDLWVPYTAIEGNRVADFQWGTASARQVVLRFWIKAPAGTYGVSISNSGLTRSFVAMYTIAAGQTNTWTAQTIVIPGDTTGTWAKDNILGMYLSFCFATGTTYHGVAGWQAGYKFATSAISNGWATVGNAFFISDVGLYLDANATGTPPPWQMPDEAQELAACLRYWSKAQVTVDTATAAMTFTFPAPMRIFPATTGGGAGYAANIGDNYSALLSQTTRAWIPISFNARM